MLNQVPQATQTLAQTQNDILVNFSVIDTAFSVNHVPYNDGSGNQGLHQFVQMPSGTPTIATGASQIGLYANTGAISGAPELFFQRAGLAANSGYAITEGLGASPGWTRLPSGIILKWKTGNSFGGGSSVTINASSIVGPPLSNIFTILITPISTSLYNNVIAISNITFPSFTVTAQNGSSVASSTTFSFLVIGN